jgi:hypothetical protein
MPRHFVFDENLYPYNKNKSINLLSKANPVTLLSNLNLSSASSFFFSAGETLTSTILSNLNIVSSSGLKHDHYVALGSPARDITQP